MHRGAEPSRLQSLALQLADKVRKISRVEERGGGLSSPSLTRANIRHFSSRSLHASFLVCRSALQLTTMNEFWTLSIHLTIETGKVLATIVFTTSVFSLLRENYTQGFFVCFRSRSIQKSEKPTSLLNFYKSTKLHKKI